MSIRVDKLAELGRHRWVLPVLAVATARKGARFVELLHALPISRESLRRALDQALAGGWIVRNPGHGHPLRPEYVVAPGADAAARTAIALAQAQGEIGLSPGALGRWALPVLRLLGEGANRFNALECGVPGASPRALTLTLKALAAQGLIERAVIEGWPPVTSYALTQRGRALAAAC